MNLLQVRTQFVKVSGRYDLVVDAASGDYSDNGANFYINAGMKMLERLADVPFTFARLFYKVEAGSYEVTFQHSARSITEVWINNNETRKQLSKLSFADFRNLYNTPVGEITTGTPVYFTLANLRALETTDQVALGTFLDKTFDEYDTNDDYRGILFGPPTDGEYIIEVSGFFKTVALADDEDENFWTIEEDDLLIRAALYKLEVFSRGTEEAKNWLSAIRDDVIEVRKDIVQEESYGIDQMEG